jgi:hypothetical protein
MKKAPRLDAGARRGGDAEAAAGTGYPGRLCASPAGGPCGVLRAGASWVALARLWRLSFPRNPSGAEYLTMSRRQQSSPR